MIHAGVDVVRLNFSHSTHERKIAVIQKIRKVSHEENKPLCILADLQGPKIRTTLLKDHQPVLLKAGHRITITPRDVPGTASLVGTTFKTLAENVEQGSRILLSDGLIELRVHEIAGDDVVCDIINGGMLGESKGINLPGVLVRTPSLTEKDSRRSRVRAQSRLRRHRRLLRAHRRRCDAWCAIAWPRTAPIPGSSPNWKSRRPSSISTPSCRWRTASWWRAAIWAWKCLRKKFPPSRSTSFAAPPSIPSR